MKITLLFIAAILTFGISGCAHEFHDSFGKKPAPEKIIALLCEGNARFVADKVEHVHCSPARRALAAEKNQGDYAVATILGCSDSRVPVELIFDGGIMDLFVVRVPGNVAREDEIGGVEYGVFHAFTPVILVLGHSDCGAVTAALAGESAHKLEAHIPALLAPIRAVVEQVRRASPELAGKDLLNACIRANVEQQIRNLLFRSAETRAAVQKGKILIAGGIYQLDSGKVEWLDPKRVEAIMATLQ